MDRSAGRTTSADSTVCNQDFSVLARRHNSHATRCPIRNSLQQSCRIDPTKLLSSAGGLQKMDNAIVSFPGFDRFGSSSAPIARAPSSAPKRIPHFAKPKRATAASRRRGRRARESMDKEEEREALAMTPWLNRGTDRTQLVNRCHHIGVQIGHNPERASHDQKDYQYAEG